MGTDVGRGLAWVPAWVLAWMLASPIWNASALHGQASLLLVDAETTVSDFEIRIDGEAPFPRSRLYTRLASRRPPTLAGLRSGLAWLPLVSAPEPIPFDPVVLQRDVVRLRRFYRSEGYPRAEVDSDVVLDTARNQVAVTLVVTSGPPRILERVEVSAPDGSEVDGLGVPDLQTELNERSGDRLGDLELGEIRDRALTWMGHRGRPFSAVELEVVEGADPLRPTVHVLLRPGPPAFVGEIHLEPGGRLGFPTVQRQLLFAPGDLFSSLRLAESAQQLLDLDLVQVALVELEPGQEADADADVRIRLVEGSPRLISGRVGYADQRGVITEAAWSHRDFQGGARTLRVTGVAETGLWAMGQLTRRRYGGSVALEQPWLFSPRISLLSGVSGDYTEGLRETAQRLGADVTAVWERGPNRFVSLRYGVSVRRVLDSRGGATGELGVLDFLRRLEDVEVATRKTALAASASWGRRDDLAQPTRGWVVSSGLELAGLDNWSDVRYLRAELSGSVLQPLGTRGVRLLARGRLGRLLPLGPSRPGDNPLRAYLRLGDALFTEGGTAQVRGWEEGALGPKLPDLEIRTVGDSVAVTPVGRYAPLGGLARWGGSLELQLPLPLLRGNHFALLFADGARVWTPEAGYRAPDGLPALGVDDGSRFGVGAGLSFSSLVGPIRLMVGYKVNPSELDLRNPASVGLALLEGRSLTEVPENPWRRWRVHLSIGQVF